MAYVMQEWTLGSSPFCQSAVIAHEVPIACEPQLLLDLEAQDHVAHAGKWAESAHFDHFANCFEPFSHGFGPISRLLRP